MPLDVIKGAIARALALVGLAPARAVVRARQAALEGRTAERTRRQREVGAASEKIRALQQKLLAAHERHVVEYAERTTLKKAVLHYWGELKRLDTVFGGYESRLPAQFAMAIEARRGTLPQMTWPLEEIAMVRQLVTGGIMLDIGGGDGATSIPRVVLSDFSTAYVLEADGERYQRLLENVRATNTGDVVRAERIAILGRGTQNTEYRIQNAEPVDATTPTSSLEDWMARRDLPAAAVRFVRIGPAAEAVGILDQGMRLMPQRNLVWQVDLGPQTDLKALSVLIGTHFSHFKEIGIYPAPHARKAAEARKLFKKPPAPELTGLLLFNLR